VEEPAPPAGQAARDLAPRRRDESARVKMAILGTRGIPAAYGGFETFAEQLSTRLAARGHSVTVYCRSHYTDRALRELRGVRLVVLPTVRTKYFDTVVHGLLSAIHAVPGRYDAILFCNAINAPLCSISKMTGSRTILNVDGLERNRRKWNALGRAAYSIAERLSAKIPDGVVTDAEVIRRYYREEFGIDPMMIPYGGDLEPPAGRSTLERLGLREGGYFLYVSRLEPENNALAVVEAYRQVRGSLPLVLLGDAPYAAEYIRRVRGRADPRVLFPGAIYGEGYRELLFSAHAYIQATEIGGTHPALVEAMGAGRVVAYHDSPENREVCGDAGIPFDAARPETLASVLNSLLDDSAPFAVFSKRAKDRVAERYRWEDITDRYERALEGRKC
jgi:glycosyltransferase involved in cell wall biosynthesis